jgi:hypothetical protein
MPGAVFIANVVQFPMPSLVLATESIVLTIDGLQNSMAETSTESFGITVYDPDLNIQEV